MRRGRFVYQPVSVRESADNWYRVMPDPDGDGWMVTKNGRRGRRFPAEHDMLAQKVADRLNGVREGGA